MGKNFDELRVRLQTVVGITVTPFDESGDIDFTKYRELVDRCTSGGLTVTTPNGNTSEFYSLSPQERLDCIEVTREQAPEAIIVAGVGLDSQTQIAEAARAFELGAESVMLHQPVHPFWSVDGWIESHRQLSEAVPGLAIIPYIRSPKITPQAIAKLVDTVPAVIAVKYAIDDALSFAQTVQLVGSDRVTWICGLAEMHAPFFALAGSSGFTSGLVNIDPSISMNMHSALQNQDYVEAMRIHSLIAPFEQLRARNASEFNVSAVKEALGQLGLSRPDVRPPLAGLPQADKDLVSEILKSWQLTA